MDGLVSNTALIAGVAAAANAHTVVISGVAGSARRGVLDGTGRVHVGHHGQRTDRIRGAGGAARVRAASQGGAGRTHRDVGQSGHDAARPPHKATDEIHRDESRAVNFHLVQELGVDPAEKPSPWVAAGSSFVMFAIGAIVPLIPYLLGFESLWAGLICGGVGLMIAGGVAATVHQ